ncbi:MAG: efflux RND transporter periplasmic adaptor subunit [Arenimonas sp.]|jgi:Cu(I)/Ag(I) efflux system membrane fusion protein
MRTLKGLALLGVVVLVAYVAGAHGNRGVAPGESPAAESLSAIAPAEAAPPPLIETVRSGYVCPMHSHITSPHKGKCPICGMDLVPQKSDAVPPASSAGAEIRLSPAVRNTLGVRIAQAVRGDMHREIETVGKITRVDSTARSILASPIAGRLEFVAEKAEGDTVAQGELLFSVSSDELMELERGYQAAEKSRKPDQASALVPGLTESGLSAEQIAELKAGAAPTMPANFYAPQDGFVFIRRGEVGDEVTPGFTVFNVGGDKRLVEVTAALFEQQWGWVREEQEAEMVVRGLPGKVFYGKVVRVDPPVGFTTRSLEVRIEFETDDEGISQNIFGRVTIKAQPRQDIVMVPSEAVIRTEAGDRVVVLAKDGAFRTVAIVAGEEAKGMTEVLSGLAGGESIIASGQFLIDSESARLADLARLSTSSAAAAAGTHQH